MDIFRHKEIIKKLPSVIILMDKPVKDILNKVLKESKDIVDNYNWSNKTIIDASNKELGTFKSCCKKVLHAYYNNQVMPIDEDVDYDEQTINKNQISQLMDLSLHLIQKLKFLNGESE